MEYQWAVGWYQMTSPAREKNDGARKIFEKIITAKFPIFR